MCCRLVRSGYASVMTLRRCIVIVLLLSFVSVVSVPPRADEAIKPPQKNLILPGEVFEVAGRTAFLFAAADGAAGAKPWILYSPTLPAYPDKAEKWMHEQFLAAGVAVAGVGAADQVGLLRPCGHAGTGAAPLHVDDGDGDLGKVGQADEFGHQRHTGSRGGREGTRTIPPCAHHHADRRHPAL